MELLTENLPLSWLCIVALFSFAELFFLNYRILWLSVGGDVGLLLALLGVPFWGQILAFVIASIALLLLSRRLVRSVRCENALQEIDMEGRNEYDTIRVDRDLGDLDQNGEGVDQMPQDDSLGDLLPLSGEGVGICEEIRDLTGVHDPG